MKLWEDIKNEYLSWPENEDGFRQAPDGFLIRVGKNVKIDDSAKIGCETEIENNVDIGGSVKIDKGTKIARNVLIFSNVKIGAYTLIQRQVTVHPYARIGAGCQIKYRVEIGHAVIVGDGVLIGENSALGHCYYTNTPSQTFIGRGTTIDKQVFVAANVTIGCGVSVEKYTTIEAKTVIGNSVRIHTRTLVKRNTKISDNIRVNGVIGPGAAMEKQPLYIRGSKHSVYLNNLDEKKIGIGCTVHAIDYWEEKYRTIGVNAGYTPEQIKEYKAYIDLFKTVYGW